MMFKNKPLILLVSLLLIAGFILSACASDTGPQAPAGTEDTRPVTGEDSPSGSETADVRSKGDPDAPVTIVEYSDFQCPYCSRWVLDTYPTLLEEYIDTGKVRLEFRDFPLNFHPNADEAAIATRCAAEQGAYWEMHDRLFESQAGWANLPDTGEAFASYADDLGLDVEAFEQCLNSGRYDEALVEDLQAGQAAGVSGTPSFLINGQLLVGAQPAQVFRQAIDTVLAGGELNTGQPQAEAPPPEPFDISIEGAAIKGDPNAPMTIIEYSDYQCPFCSRFVLQTMPALVQEYIDSGQAKLVFKDFPLTSIHPQAQKASEATRCVRELTGNDDSYWAMHDLLFEGQQEWGNSRAPEIFAGYAEQLGVARDDFSACLESGQFADAVKADLEEGVALGVRGTPTFFLNGQAFVGAQPITNFRQAIAAVEAGQNIQPPPPPTPAPRPTPAPLPQDVPLDDAAGIVGNPDAPITIVEYSDYQCPFCQRHVQQTMPGLQKYIEDGTVKYVFKDFPLLSIHPQAAKASEAARCAGDQDAYWEMHDRLFAGQQQWSGNPAAVDVYKGYADQLNLDRTTFDACLDGGTYSDVVMANLQEGSGFGIQGTPGFFVNRQPLPGAYPIEAFEALIQAELDR
ncbi:MAG: thioredoxin domain-containing protein [Chloroflexota bacterium]|nr:thioredoxin domain-containing protein [Chloroflexota bacterium]